MDRLWRYYGSYRSLRGQVGGLPGWARTVLVIAALPGIALIGLSILAFLVSLLALLLLTVPLHRLLQGLTGSRTTDEPSAVEIISGGDMPGDWGGPGRKRVEAKVLDDTPDQKPGTSQG